MKVKKAIERELKKIKPNAPQSRINDWLLKFTSHIKAEDLDKEENPNKPIKIGKGRYGG